MPSGEGRRRGRAKRLTGIAVIGLVVLGVGAYASTYTSIFGARIIRVEGQRRIPAEQVQRLAGVESGVNVFHLNTGAAERKLEADPRVQSASVSTDLPSTVIISITERLPVAMAAGDTAGLNLIGADGVVLGPATGKEVLPTIVIADRASLDPGALRSYASAAGSMSPALRRQVKSLVVQAGGSLELDLRSGVTASFGQPTDISQKGQALEGVLTWAEAQGEALESVDVSVPSAPTARLAGGAVVSP